MTGLARRPEVDWRAALAAIVGAHAGVTLLLRLPSVLAPVLIMDHGWTATLVGAVTGLATGLSVLLMMSGAGVVRALGSKRALQAGLLSGIVALALLALQSPLLAIMAAIFIGMAHAPMHPAGNDLLERYAAPGRRSIVFSVKQSGPSFGGIVAGLMLPMLAAAGGTELALGGAAALLLSALILCSVLVRDENGVHRSSSGWREAFSRRSIVGPLRTVVADAALRRMALLGATLSLVSSVWMAYLPIYLSLHVGMDVALAGVGFALFQAGAFSGRILLGWVADRFLPPRAIISLAMLGSAVLTAALPLLATLGFSTALLALALPAGIFTAGWSGVQLAEAVRVAGRERLVDAISGLMVITGLGVVGGPFAFLLIVAGAGNWSGGFVILSVLPAAALILKLLTEGVHRT